MSSSTSKSSFVNIVSTGGSQSSSLDEDDFSTISSTPLPNDVSGMPAMDDMPSPIPSDAEEIASDMTANIDLKTRNAEVESGEDKMFEEHEEIGEGSSSKIEELKSIIKSLQEKVASQQDQIFDILVENSILKDQVEQKKKRENSGHLQLVKNLQQTIVDQAMTMKDQKLKIKILSSQLETLKLAKVEEPEPRLILSEGGKPMDDGITEKKRVSILRIRSVPVSSYWPTGETRIVQRKASNLEPKLILSGRKKPMNERKAEKEKEKLEQQLRMEEVEKSWSKFCIKDSESAQTSRPSTTLDQKSLLTKSHAILNPDTLKSELAETEKLLSENLTSSVLEQKILEVEYANQQISMIIETNDLQKAEDDSRHEEEMQVLRDKIEDLERVIQCLKKI